MFHKYNVFVFKALRCKTGYSFKTFSDAGRILGQFCQHWASSHIVSWKDKKCFARNCFAIIGTLYLLMKMIIYGVLQAIIEIITYF